jgi:hypothetical protein
MKSLVGLVVLSLTASIAPAQTKVPDMTVLGFHLGEKFAIAECARMKKFDFYADNDPAPCFQRWFEKTRRYNPIVNEMVSIVFSPFSQRPPIMSTSKIAARVIDGNLESINFETMSLQTQDRMLDALKEKYGDPTTLTELKKQNAFGASYDSILAVWEWRS